MHILYLGICPECGGNLHHSRRRGIIENALFRILFIRVKRCHRCMGRFYCPPLLVFRGRRLSSERHEQEEGAEEQSPD
jgi:hypothetical protein